MQQILEYLTKTYSPKGILVYGSYTDGSNNADSDFDALVLTDDHEKKHDHSTVHGIVLDVFLYPADIFQKPFNCDDFLQLYGGKIIMDKTGSLAMAKKKVIAWIENTPRKSDEEILRNLEWCEKMIRRAYRNDAEGYYRHHWVLMDSLQFYCDIRGIYYFGPKKTLRKMEKEDSGFDSIQGICLGTFYAKHERITQS